MGKESNPASFCAAAWQEPVGSRDAMEGVGESNGLSGGDRWSSGEKAVKHLLVDRMQSGSNSFSLLCEWPGISADVRRFSGFQLCSLFGMTCHDKSVASFGNETRWLSFVRAKTFEIYSHLSALYILLSKYKIFVLVGIARYGNMIDITYLRKCVGTGGAAVSVIALTALNSRSFFR